MRTKSVRSPLLLMTLIGVGLFGPSTLRAIPPFRGPSLKVILQENSSALDGQLVTQGGQVHTYNGGFVDYKLHPWASIDIYQSPCATMTLNTMRRRGKGVITRLSLNHWRPLTCLTQPRLQIKSKFLSKDSGIELKSGDAFMRLLGTDIKLQNWANVVTLGVNDGIATITSEEGQGSTVTLTPGQYSIQSPGEPPSPAQVAPPLDFASLVVKGAAIEACVSAPNRLEYQGRLVEDNCIRVPPQSELTITGPLNQQAYRVSIQGDLAAVR